MKKLYTFLTILISSIVTKAQEATETVEMADLMRSNGKIYVVVAVVAVIFTGIIVYLVNLDSKIAKIEKRIK